MVYFIFIFRIRKPLLAHNISCIDCPFNAGVWAWLLMVVCHGVSCDQLKWLLIRLSPLLCVLRDPLHKQQDSSVHFALTNFSIYLCYLFLGFYFTVNCRTIVTVHYQIFLLISDLFV